MVSFKHILIHLTSFFATPNKDMFYTRKSAVWFWRISWSHFLSLCANTALCVTGHIARKCSSHAAS